MKWLLTLSLIISGRVICFSQSSLLFNHYTVEQGLSDNAVNDMVQDDNGFTWLATTNGLNRFDGVQFKHFFRTSNNPEIPDNFILHIHKWKDHSLVIATRNGLGILNTQNGKCQIILIPSPKEISRQTNFIEYLETTSHNEIVAGSSTGVYVFDEGLRPNSGTYEIKGSTIIRHPIVAKNVEVMTQETATTIYEFKLEGDNTLWLSAPRSTTEPGFKSKLTRVE